MKARIQLLLTAAATLLLLSSGVFAQTATPTDTATPTNTFTPTPTFTPTNTYAPAVTPVATANEVSGLLSPHVVEWRKKTFTAINSGIILVPVSAASKRQAVFYLDVVASGAGTVTVTIGGVNIDFVFASGNLDFHQTRTFVLPPMTAQSGYVYAKQSAASTTTVLVGSMEMRQ